MERLRKNKEYEDKIKWYNTRKIPNFDLHERTDEKYPYLNDDLPEFIFDIYDDYVFTNSAKDDFRENFVDYYMSNEGFRYYVRNHIVLFLNYTFYGIYRKMEEAVSQGDSGDLRHVFNIAGAKILYGYMEIPSLTDQISGDELFRIDCELTNFSENNENKITYNINYLYDPGCSCCEFNEQNEIENDRFITLRMNNKTGQKEIDERFVELNNRIKSVRILKYKTANGTIKKKEIIFKENMKMFMKIGNEGHVNVESLIIPMKKILDKINSLKTPQKPYNLMGLSITKQLYTMSYPNKKSSNLIVKSCPSNKKGFKVYELTDKMIIYLPPHGKEFKVYYDVFKILEYCNYLKNKYKHLNLDDILDKRIDENAYLNISDNDIFYTTKNLYLLVVESEDELPVVLKKLNSENNIYSGYVTSYDINSSIYIKDWSNFISPLDTLDDIYEDMIMPIYKHENGCSFTFLDL